MKKRTLTTNNPDNQNMVAEQEQPRTNEDTDAMKIERNIHIQITRMERFTAKAEDIMINNYDITHSTIETIDSILPRLEKEVNNLEHMIETWTSYTTDQLDSNISDAKDKCEDIMYSLKARKESILRQLEQYTKNMNTQSNSNALTTPHYPIHIKLPRLEMPTFSGDVTKWKEFWECFQHTVHDNTQISTIDKFSYLKSKLQGGAKDAVYVG